MSVHIAPLLRDMWELVDQLVARIDDLETENEVLRNDKSRLIAEEVFNDRRN